MVKFAACAQHLRIRTCSYTCTYDKGIIDIQIHREIERWGKRREGERERERERERESRKKKKKNDNNETRKKEKKKDKRKSKKKKRESEGERERIVGRRGSPLDRGPPPRPRKCKRYTDWGTKSSQHGSASSHGEANRRARRASLVPEEGPSRLMPLTD